MKNSFFDNFTRIETENEVTLKSTKPDKDGFTFTLTFTKNEQEHEESIKVIKEFFLKEIL
jgi:hypothetical protein